MKGQIAVFGATGRTGRFVVAELAARGLPTILVGRDRARLEAVACHCAAGAPIRVARLDRPASLDAALEGASAVINCAGPFLDTAPPVLDAALRTRIHYVDLTAEQAAAAATLSDYADASRRAGIVVVPAIAFYGGLADLLATAALGDWPRCDRVVVAVSLDSWQPTRGTRLTGERNAVPRVIFTRGRLERIDENAPSRWWSFPPPFGDQRVVQVPLSEIITISHHLPTPEIRSFMNLKPLEDLSDPDTPPPLAVDARGRSPQLFCMDVIVEWSDERRRAIAQGQDIYAVSAPLAVEAVTRILMGHAKRSGTGTIGELFDARSFLDSLDPENVVLSLP